MRWLKIDLKDTIPEFIIKTLDNILVRADPLVLPCAMTSRTLTSNGVIDIMKTTCNLLEIEYQTGAIFTKEFRFNTRRNSLMILTTSSRILSRLVMEMCSETQRYPLLEPWVHDLLKLGDRILKVLQDAEDDYTREHFRSAILIKTSLVDVTNVLSQDSAIWNDLDSRPLLPASDCSYGGLWTPTVEAMNHEAIARWCSSPDCDKTFLNTWLFKRCTDCKIHRYCSLICQKNAWRHTAAPHCKICAVLRHVRVRNHLRGKRLLVVPVQPATLGERLGWLVVEHLAVPTQYKMATPSKIPLLSTRHLSLT